MVNLSHLQDPDSRPIKPIPGQPGRTGLGDLDFSVWRLDDNIARQHPGYLAWMRNWRRRNPDAPARSWYGRPGSGWQSTLTELVELLNERDRIYNETRVASGLGPPRQRDESDPARLRAFAPIADRAIIEDRWHKVRDNVKTRRPALHWQEETVKKHGAPGGKYFQESLEDLGEMGLVKGREWQSQMEDTGMKALFEGTKASARGGKFPKSKKHRKSKKHKGTRKGMRRKTARKAYMKRKKSRKHRKH